MKTKLIYLSLVCFIGLIASCTPTPLNNESNAHKAPTIYGTGGEHSAEPDNDKD
ncbi:MAG: hypothetical protein JJE55_12965 [Flavobacteriaceae bacterium]|nr:hypothetical protein [Flavobacteriaceae bacterium]